jgi:hypothetical protein
VSNTPSSPAPEFETNIPGAVVARGLSQPETPLKRMRHSDAGLRGTRFLNPRIACALGVALVACVLYASCLSSTVTYGGDCGELIAASWRLGIAHPTGYALYCLLGRFFATIFPVGEVAFRYNLLSALCGAASVGFVTATVHRLTASQINTAQASGSNAAGITLKDWPALGAGLLLTGFYYFWSQGVLAEVYALNALMLAALLYAAVAWHQEADWRWAYTAAALFGLALTAHLSCIYFAPGLFLFVVVQHRERFGIARGWWKHGTRMLLLAITAYGLALYLPIRAGLFPTPPPGAWWPLDWSHPVDAAHFIEHITARQYRKWLVTTHEVALLGRILHIPVFIQPWAITWAKLSYFAGMFGLQLLWCAPLALVGFFAAWRRSRHDETPTTGIWLAVLLLSAFACNIGVQIHYTVGDQTNFFFPAYIVLAIWLGLGIAALLKRFPRLSPIWICGIVACFTVQVAMFHPLVSMRGKTEARDSGLLHAEAIERLARQTGRIPQVILSSDDALFSFWYAKFVLSRAPQSATPWGPERKGMDWVKLVQRWKRRGPVVLTEWDNKIEQRFPYVMLTDDGGLCLASDRLLPPPAAFLTAAPKNDSIKTRPPLAQASFRGEPGARGVAVVKRSELAAFDVVFRLSDTTPLTTLDTGGVTVAPKEQAAHVGYIEVLMAREGLVKRPSPTQPAIRKPVPGVPPVVAWRQQRRLIVPLGSTKGQLLRAGVPLQMHSEAQIGLHDVWVRIVRHSKDTRMPWQKIASVQLT